MQSMVDARCSTLPSVATRYDYLMHLLKAPSSFASVPVILALAWGLVGQGCTLLSEVDRTAIDASSTNDAEPEVGSETEADTGANADAVALDSLQDSGFTDVPTDASIENDSANDQAVDDVSLDISIDSTADSLSDSPGDSSPDTLQDTLLDTPTDMQSDTPVDTAQDTVLDVPGATPPIDPAWPGPPWFGCTPSDEPDEATVVTVFNQADQYFSGEDNRRSIDADVVLPASGGWQRIDMILKLECPADGKCDHWDRLASVSLVEEAGTPHEQLLEIERYITPYRTQMCFRTDVTHLASRLHGVQKVRSFIDTWVGPSSSSYGHGWRVTVKFVYHPGTPKPGVIPEQVVVLWPFVAPEIGNADKPFDAAMGVRTVPIPSWVSRAQIRSVATGHGQGNSRGCAEFCPMLHEVTAGDKRFEFLVWRDDCAKNPLQNKQAGTWRYNRAGWCPGAYSVPAWLDVTLAIAPSQPLSIRYDTLMPTHEPYENTCRPGAGDEQNRCVGCVYDSAAGNCDYNDGNHTTPHHRISTLLLLYR